MAATPTPHSTEPFILPFLKWAGGKRWLAASFAEIIGDVEGTYFEPFAGSAAMLFSVRPRNAVLADANCELIETYNAVKDAPDKVENLLRLHHAAHCSEYYYSVRSMVLQSPVERAARFIYLNRTCWNGLYRVNLKGKFNVPRGTKTAVILDSDDFKSVSNFLQRARIVSSDFEPVVNCAGQGDVVFCDPPYTILHNYNGFIKYNENLFSWADQIRLRDCLVRARDRGVRVFATNADHPSVRQLYEGHFELMGQHRFSSIAGAKAVRGKYAELIIVGDR